MTSSSNWNLGECLECGDIWLGEESYGQATMHALVYDHNFVMYRTESEDA